VARPLPDLVEHACELFAPLGAIRVKAMFGGWGFYCDELFFALVAAETLYLKTDAESVSRFSDAGGEPFRFTYKNGRTETMNYWTVPGEALESPAEMRPWGRLALAAALRARQPKKTQPASARRPRT
jgi:DNA transformation protein and related proteins